MSDPATGTLERIGLPNATARIAVGLVTLVVLGAMIDLERAHALLTASRDAVVSFGDTLFVIVANLCLLILAVVAVHPVGRGRLGADGERPGFGRPTWLAMLFSAGLASGILYWATAEPVLHAAANPSLVALPIRFTRGNRSFMKSSELS